MEEHKTDIVKKCYNFLPYSLKKSHERNVIFDFVSHMETIEGSGQ